MIAACSDVDAPPLVQMIQLVLDCHFKLSSANGELDLDGE